MMMPIEFDSSFLRGCGMFGTRVMRGLLLLGMVSGCSPHGEPSEETPGPEGLMREWVEMWNSYDIDQVPNLFLDDDRLTYFSSEKEGVIRGMEAVLEHHRGFGFLPGGDSKPTRLWVEGLRTDLLGEMAIITGIWFFQSTEESAGEPQKGPVTFVCVREGGEWRFVHMNFSEYLPPEPL
jgi:ketosteroid isomerase-like protein